MIFLNSPEAPVTLSQFGARGAALILALALGACAKDAKVTPPPGGAGPSKATAQKIRLRHLRFSSDEEKYRWERAILAVWETPLGELFSEYLFTPTEDHADLPLWARMITDRIFSKLEHIDVRLAAIQIMKDDLYVREQLNADVTDRILIIDGHFEREHSRIKREGPRMFLANAGASLLLAIPAGSPAVRHIERKERLALLNRYRRLPAYEPGYNRAAEFAKYRKFSKSGTFNAIFYIYPFLQGAEWLWQSLRQTPGYGPKDQELLLGRDDLVTAIDLTAENLSHYIPKRKVNMSAGSTPARGR